MKQTENCFSSSYFKQKEWDKVCAISVEAIKDYITDLRVGMAHMVSTVA